MSLDSTKKILALLLITGVLSLLFFMVVGVHHGEHGTGCIAASVQNADCPTNVAAAIPFHLSALKDLFATAPGANTGLIVMLTVLFALATFFGSLFANFLRAVRYAWAVTVSVLDIPSERDFIRWLAYHEVSPTVTT